MSFHMEDWPSLAVGWCEWHFSRCGHEMQTNQYLLFLHATSSLLVHGSGVSWQLPLVTALGGRMFWWNGLHAAGVKQRICLQHFLHALPKLFQGFGRAVQHCLHSKHDNNNQFTIIVRSHCAVQSCGISMYHYDLRPRPPRSPLWAPPPIVHAYTRWAKSFLVCVSVSFVVSKEACEQRSLQFIFLCQRLFFKGKESNRCHMIAFLFWTDTVQSRKTA